MSPPRICIVFGGTSDERRVSVASAQNIAQALPESQLWFLSPTGKVHPTSLESLQAQARPFETDFVAESATVGSLAHALKANGRDGTVYFLALHGGEGEDGTIQALLEAAGVPYTGSDSKASARAFHKKEAKLIAKKNGLKVTPDLIVRGDMGEEAKLRLEQFSGDYGALMMKPVSGGSSIGLVKIKNESDLDIALNTLKASPSTSFIAEPFVTGREITVGVINTNTELMALPPSEVVLSTDGNFDYEGKYLGRGSQEITPASLSEVELKQVQQMALTAHLALNCEGYSRTDIILSSSGPVYLETNTLPGLTKASFIPQQLEVAKIPFVHFLTTQILLAEKRGQASRHPVNRPAVSASRGK